MNYKKLIAATVALTVCAFTGSNVTAHAAVVWSWWRRLPRRWLRWGWFCRWRFSRRFRGGDFRGAGFSRRFRGAGFRGGFGAIGSVIAISTIGSSSLAILGNPFFTIRIRVLSLRYYPYDYGTVYDSYNQPVYQGSAGYADSVIGEVRLVCSRRLLSRCDDGVSGSERGGPIRAYEHAHALPQDGESAKDCSQPWD